MIFNLRLITEQQEEEEDEEEMEKARRDITPPSFTPTYMC